MVARSRRAAQAAAPGRGSRVSSRFSARQTYGEGETGRLAEADIRGRGRSGLDLRLPGQTLARVQAPAVERAACRGALQPAARKRRSADDSAHVPVWR